MEPPLLLLLHDGPHHPDDEEQHECAHHRERHGLLTGSTSEEGTSPERAGAGIRPTAIPTRLQGRCGAPHTGTRFAPRSPTR